MHTFRLPINLATAGLHTLVPGVAGSRLKIYKLVLWPHADVTVILKDGATPINGIGFAMAAKVPLDLDFPEPLVLKPYHSLMAELSASVPVTGFVQFTHDGSGLPAED